MFLCLALNIYFEARDQSVDGQRMVAEVTMERADGGDICDTVWQPGAFSWTTDGKSDEPKEEVAWMLAQDIAMDVILNGCEFCTGATHYHEKSIHPYWADDYTVVGMVGDHIFYTTEVN